MRVMTSTGGNALCYLQADHLGSTSLTTNSSGGVVGELKYYPYGVTRYTSGSTPTPRRFTGQLSEEATLGSLYFFNARFYSPALGRFLSADTLVPEPGDPQTLNRYSYVNNNPLRYIDPTGHEGCSIDNIGSCTEDELKGLTLEGMPYWGRSFINYWFELLGQTQTGRLLLDGLKAAGIDITESSVVWGHLSGDAAATAEKQGHGLWQVKLDFLDFWGNLQTLLSDKAGGLFVQGLNNLHAYWAAKIGHELFHIAIGDQNEGPNTPLRAVGDCGPGGTCMAYRVEGKIVNEILYDGRKANYRPGSKLTGKSFDQWGYDQAASGYPGALAFTRQFSENSRYFRADPRVVRALMIVPLPSNRR